MVAVVGDSEIGLNDFGDSGGSPEVGSVSIADGAFGEDGDETFFLSGGEL